ncbi:hypothetical protein ABI59_06830 [Acidobacteria bacterium Mor1]|nr:hypothetical protein ABI59_06830 [Acidobacteria bacterium Mor1]
MARFGGRDALGRWAVALLTLLAATLVAAGEGAGEAEEPAFRFDGEIRLGYQVLDGQFRPGLARSDDIALSRTLLHARYWTGRATFGLEAIDARTYGGDIGSALSTTVVDAADLLQAYARIDLSDADGGGPRKVLTLGRQTIGTGSRRVVGRNVFRNTINAFTGAHFQIDWQEGQELQVFYVVPVRRLPFDKSGLVDNDISADEESWGVHFWGAHFTAAETPGRFKPEYYIYGQHERDRSDLQTPNRRLIWPGFRARFVPARGAFDLDVDAMIRFGEQRLTSDPLDTRDVDVRAHRVHVEVGYTFGHPWSPRVALDYDRASGDDDPENGDFERWETFYGPRRRDLGATDIYAAIAWSNLDAPGAHFELRPSKRLFARLAYKSARLASARDVWIVPRLRDPSGASGRFIGHQLDGMARYWLIPGTLKGELGFSALYTRRFARQAPGSPEEPRTLFGYLQLSWLF